MTKAELIDAVHAAMDDGTSKRETAELVDSIFDKLSVVIKDDGRFSYPGFGTFAAGDFVFEWPFHDHKHLQQILAITKAAYLPSMTDTMRNALTGSDG